MDIVDLLATFSNPLTLEQLSFSQKLIAGLIATLLGMGITFLSLIILQVAITLMARLSAVQAVNTAKRSSAQPVPAPAVPGKLSETAGNEEVIAAITAAVALLLNTSTSNLVIKDIRKKEDSISAWSRAGIVEQMQNNG